MTSSVFGVGVFTVALLALTAHADAGGLAGPTPEQQKRHLELFHNGQSLWPIYCNHCHNARNPSEFAPYQWDQIMMHMSTGR